MTDKPNPPTDWDLNALFDEVRDESEAEIQTRVAEACATGLARIRELEARLAEAEALISHLADTVQGYALGEMVGNDLEDAEATVARARAFLEGK